MKYSMNQREEFKAYLDDLKEILGEVRSIQNDERVRFGNIFGLKHLIFDVRLSTVKTIELAIETAIDLITYHLSINKFDNLGYKVRHVLLTQPHFALDNLFAHSVDMKEANNLVEQSKASTQVETDTKPVQSKKQRGFQQKFDQLQKAIPKFKLGLYQIT